MPIKVNRHTARLFSTFLIFFIGFIQTTHAQVVWENYRNEVYNYLSHMAQKGVITFDDMIKPLSRSYIAKSLQELTKHPEQLSSIEKKELQFYLQEYQSDLDSSLNVKESEVSFFKKDDQKRWRAFSIKSKDFILNGDPIFQGAKVYNSNKNYLHQSIGIEIWGKIGKHFGFQFSGNDITESRDGSGTDSFAFKQPQTGFLLLSDSSDHKSLNYSEIRANIGYSFKNGSISFGQDYLLWGYGQNGRIVLSDKSPTYPYIRLDYQPFKWLKFQYVHAWLNSSIIDSGRTYGFGNTVYGGQRIIYIPKYMATHSITFKPTKNIDISAGESIIYSDQLNVGYLIPVMLFKVYDNLTSNKNILAGSNGQFFLQVSSRNLLKNTHLYSTLFIDEMRIAQMFSKERSRNQIGFTIGASVTDIFIPYLTLNAEYTRVNPFTYNNLNPAQTYTNQKFNLGDWMGSNFDRTILSAQYTPLPKLKCMARYQYIRKGSTGTVDQQYNQGYSVPSSATPFLFNLQYTQTEAYLHFSYEWVHNLYMNTYFSSVQQNNKINNSNTTTITLGVGISYGL
jgi:hypothetical protein